MPERWVVLVEAAGDAAHGAIDRGDVERLQRVLDRGSYGGVLYCRDRYLLQVATINDGPVEALFDVVSRWRDAVGSLELPAWKLVRTEVFRPEELERELEAARRQETAHRPSSTDPRRDDDVGHELLRQAFSDPLTGLLGREAFGHRLEAVLSESGSTSGVAVVRLDLDSFAEVNHTFGGETGDEILIRMAERLAAVLRPTDRLGRFGGDEYVSVLEESTEETARAVADRMLDVVRLPVTVFGRSFTLAASAGVAVSRPGDGAQALLSNAKVALTVAKAAGGDHAGVYGPEVVHSVPIDEHFPTAALQDRLTHLVLLQRGAVAANEAGTLSQAAKVVIQQICAHIGCAAGRLMVPLPSACAQAGATAGWLAVDTDDRLGWQGLDEPLWARSDVSLAARASATGRPVWISDLADEELSARGQAAAAELVSAFAVPVLVGREVVAVLEFFSRTRMEPTGPFVDVLASIGIQLGRVVERQRAGDTRRRSEARLRESEGRLREAQGVARLGSWHFDLRTGHGNWSDGMYDLYGLEPGQPLDLDAVLATVKPDDCGRVQAALARLVETGAPAVEEFRIQRADGEIRWHRSHASAIRGDDGVVVAIQGTAQDINDAKLAEEALREKERQLAEAQQRVGLGWWEYDLSSGRLTWSDEMYRLWGLEPGRDITLDAFLASVHPDDFDRVSEPEARLRRTGESCCVDFRATVADGRERWFRGRAHLVEDQDGAAVKLFGATQDITDQKQAEEDLRAAKEWYQRIVETTHEGIVTVDAEDIISFVNQRMANLLGYSVEEMVGMPVRAIVGDDDAAALMSRHRRRRRAGMGEHHETRMRAEDGAVVPVLISHSPLFDEDGAYAGALAMVTDIAAVREAEDILWSHGLRQSAYVDEADRGRNPS